MESIQRSFRLSASTCGLLDAMAEASNESRNSLVERLLAESLRTERHPLIRFRTGAAGRREPLIIGTRVLVRQVIAIVREGGVAATAQTLDIPARAVQAAVSYYADFGDEIDADIAWSASIEALEFARWQREQAATA